MNIKTFAKDTEDHAIDVETMLVGVAKLLATAGFHHDMHKYTAAEGYVEFLEARARGESGLAQVYAEHVETTRHHMHKKRLPMEDATLIDVIAMLADWVSASRMRGTILDPASTHLPALDFETLMRNTLRVLVTIATDLSVREILEVTDDLTIARGAKQLPKLLKSIAYDIDGRYDVDSTHREQAAAYGDLLNSRYDSLVCGDDAIIQLPGHTTDDSLHRPSNADGVR